MRFELLIVPLSILFTLLDYAESESHPYCANLHQYVCEKNEPILIPSIQEQIADFGWRETLTRIESDTVD